MQYCLSGRPGLSWRLWGFIHSAPGSRSTLFFQGRPWSSLVFWGCISHQFPGQCRKCCDTCQLQVVSQHLKEELGWILRIVWLCQLKQGLILLFRFILASAFLETESVFSHCKMLLSRNIIGASLFLLKPLVVITVRSQILSWKSLVYWGSASSVCPQ